MRLHGIEGCRAIAAMLIVLFHTWGMAGKAGGVAGWTFSRMWVGVPFFFVLSGFLLYRPWAAATVRGDPLPSIATYGRRRVARIVPGYWFAALTALVILGDVRLNATVGSAARDLAFGQIYARPGSPSPLITPAWTLCIEVIFYTTLPLIAVGLARVSRGRPGVIAAALAGVAAVGIVCFAVGLPRELAYLEWIDLFAFGMIAAVAAETGWLRDRLLVGVALVVAGSVFLHVAAWAALPILAAGLALVVLRVSSRRTVLDGRAVVWVGTISYGVFLWHYQVMLIAHTWTDSAILLFAATVPLTVAFAALSWYAIERPAIRLGRGPRSLGTIVPDQARA